MRSARRACRALPPWNPTAASSRRSTRRNPVSPHPPVRRGMRCCPTSRGRSATGIMSPRSWPVAWCWRSRMDSSTSSSAQPTTWWSTPRRSRPWTRRSEGSSRTRWISASTPRCFTPTISLDRRPARPSGAGSGCPPWTLRPSRARGGGALGLHESQASRRRSITDVPSRGWQESRGGAAALIGGWADAVEAELAEPTTTLPTGPAPDPSVRSVVFDGDRPVGVIAEPMPLPSAGDLATAATRVTVPVPGRVRRRDERRTTSARAAPPSPSPLPPPPPETPIEVAHFRAAMPAQTTTGAVVTVTVLVSPEILAAAGSGEVEARGQAPISPHRPVLIQVIPKAHVEVVGDDRAEVPVPLPAQGVELYFDIRPTHAGEGEVVVIARQGPAPLVTLRLKPMIAASDQLATAAPGRQTTAECAVDLAGAPDEPSSLHWLRIEETKQGDDTVYQYDFQAEDLKVLGTYRSQPLIGDHKAYVRQRYHEIERRWLSAAGDTEAFEAELRAFGGDLFDRLLPEELQRLLWKHRRRLKVMVLSSEPFIPWELVHLKPRSRGPLPRETVFLGQLGAVRWLHGTWPPDQLRIRSGRARFVIPRYPHPDWALPQAEAEQQFLKEHFGASAVTPDENTIRKLLARRGAFDLLHFAGHGFAESEDIANAQVMLTGRVQNGNYIPAYLTATTVRQYGQLRGRTGNGPIIVFNACQTGRLGHQLTSLGGFAEAFLSVGAAAFISSLWSVGDVPARTFTEALYTALLDGESVSDATSAARVKAREAGDATWLAYRWFVSWGWKREGRGLSHPAGSGGAAMTKRLPCPPAPGPLEGYAAQFDPL